ncbi:hypothetical protein [Alteribacillus bidgolensis]|uniref:Uncharacterized protein n=1 Tax=Alteribacillus bidgolensis TaxID=930129 RepID=A0A1G8MEZ1_9BACI|nr:hypothetical protein [Alteribacillus bidgolensis]SDI66504.1 hypothetical protein SAMN05216352_11017 [Alteribacillus bidgolensis]
MLYTFSPEVRLLLVNESDETVEVTYLSYDFVLPKIGPRPPYFAHPSSEPYYPVI